MSNLFSCCFFLLFSFWAIDVKTAVYYYLYLGSLEFAFGFTSLTSFYFTLSFLQSFLHPLINQFIHLLRKSFFPKSYFPDFYGCCRFTGGKK